MSRERNLHLSTNSYDKRLLILNNISNGLYKIGLRNGELLDRIYFIARVHRRVSYPYNTQDD